MKEFNQSSIVRRITLLLPFFLCFLTIILRFPTIWRPFDSIYETQLAFIGREAFRGGGFYATPWSQKPPGEVYVYGLTYVLFGAENWAIGVRIVLVVLSALTALFIYKLGKKLFGIWVGFFAALFFTLFFSRADVFYGTATYSEMLMPFFTILGFYLFFVSREKESKPVLFFSGLSLGISLLFKPSAIYDFSPLLLFSFGEKFLKLKKKDASRIANILISQIPLVSGFLLPMSIFVFYIILIGRFSFFWDWTVMKPLQYTKLREKNPFIYIKTIFNKTYPVWILAWLTIFTTFIHREANRIAIFLWAVFVILTFIVSGKYWSYYFIQLFLPLSVLAGIFMGDIISLKKKWITTVFFSVIVLILFSMNRPYYNQLYRLFSSFVNQKITKEEYLLAISDGVYWKKMYQVGNYLKENMKPGQTLLSMEGPPGIYVFADKFSAYKDFIYAQQFYENPTIGFASMNSFETYDGNRQKLLEKMKDKPPDYIALDIISPTEITYKINKFPLFFSTLITNYKLVKKIDDVVIYQLKKSPITIPDNLVLDYDFVKNFAKITTVGRSKVIFNSLEDGRILFETTLKD